jgi:hypothetical protein
MDSTIVYLSSNMEDERFEKKIRKILFQNSLGIPIVSVSRKPIDFGKNICVGENPVCYANAMRQLLVGLHEAKTKYVHMAAADVLYPPESFMFEPLTQDCIYKYLNVWILYGWVGKRHGTGYWEQYKADGGAMVCNRLYWISQLERCISDDWNDATDPPEPFDTTFVYGWSSPNPAVNIKTGHSVSKYTRTSENTLETLPLWGNAVDIRREFCGNNGG